MKMAVDHEPETDVTEEPDEHNMTKNPNKTKVHSPDIQLVLSSDLLCFVFLFFHGFCCISVDSSAWPPAFTLQFLNCTGLPFFFFFFARIRTDVTKTLDHSVSLI